MNELNLVRLQHMLEAATEAVAFARHETRKTLESDRKLALALAMLVTIIGEAASRVTKEFQIEQSQIRWSDIVGTRNYLVHAYFKVDLDILWDIISNDLPILIPQLETIISSSDQTDEQTNS